MGTKNTQKLNQINNEKWLKRGPLQRTQKQKAWAYHFKKHYTGKSPKVVFKDDIIKLEMPP